MKLYKHEIFVQKLKPRLDIRCRKKELVVSENKKNGNVAVFEMQKEVKEINFWKMRQEDEKSKSHKSQKDQLSRHNYFYSHKLELGMILTVHHGLILQ